MNWEPPRKKGMVLGIVWIVLVLMVDALLLWRVVGGALNGWTFICALVVLASLPAIALLGYWAYGLAQLRYEFDRNRLIIHTAAGQQVVPMDSITQVLDGRKTHLRVHMRSLFWPGYWIGHGRIEDVGLTLFFAATPPHQQAILITPTLAYGISVADMDTFVEVFQAAQRMGVSHPVEHEPRQAAYLHWPIWSDRLTQSVWLGNLSLSVALFGLTCFRYPYLPGRLPMHFDSGGVVDRIAGREQVFALPVIGLLVWLFNGLIGAVLYRHQRVASLLVWSGALTVQVLFLLALFNLVK